MHLPPDTPAEETDLWWGAYSFWALLPAYAISLLLVAGVAIASGCCWHADLAAPQFIWHTALALVLFVSLPPLLLGAYRAVTHTYRLTTCRLFRDRGLHHPAAGEVALHDVTAVHVHQSAWQRRLGIGRVVVQFGP